MLSQEAHLHLHSLAGKFQWPGNLIQLLNAMLLTLQHSKSGNASLLRCSMHRIHTRVCAHLTTQAGGSINNANKLCHLGSQPRGIILLGDSAGAHFHIPPDWITASQMSLVSNLGSNHAGCAGLCVCFPLALYKCDARSKQVQISLLSTICHQRHIHSHFSSVQFKHCDKNNRLITRAVSSIREGGWCPCRVERKPGHSGEALVVQPPRDVVLSSASCKMKMLIQGS